MVKFQTLLIISIFASILLFDHCDSRCRRRCIRRFACDSSSSESEERNCNCNEPETTAETAALKTETPVAQPTIPVISFGNVTRRSFVVVSPDETETEAPVTEATEETANDQTEEPVSDQTEEPASDQTEEPASDQTEEPTGEQTDQTDEPSINTNAPNPPPIQPSCFGLAQQCFDPAGNDCCDGFSCQIVGRENGVFLSECKNGPPPIQPTCVESRKQCVGNDCCTGLECRIVRTQEGISSGGEQQLCMAGTYCTATEQCCQFKNLVGHFAVHCDSSSNTCANCELC